jgi:hypothetical protein
MGNAERQCGGWMKALGEAKIEDAEKQRLDGPLWQKSSVFIVA